ncbi:MAG: hypothetical protein QNI94_05960 [Kiloniellales bacterium]|nr:hypothetical protein [Kiloniellales bacterium]
MRCLVLAAALSLAAVGAGYGAQGGARVTVTTSTPGVVLSDVEAVAADRGGIVLTITSPAPGTPFSAVCTFLHDGTQTTEDHSGRAPATLRFDAEGLRCELSSEGPLKVVAEDARGNRSMSSTSGGRILLSLSF